MNTKNHESETLVMDEPKVFFEKTNVSANETDADGKYTGLLGKLLDLANKQSEMGLGITHEQFLVERKLRQSLGY